MRSLKTLVVTVGASMALVVAFGGSTASATQLCKETDTWQKCTAYHGYNTLVTNHFALGTKTKFFSNLSNFSCQRSYMTGNISSTGGWTLSIKNSALEFKECTREGGLYCTMSSLDPGQIMIEYNSYWTENRKVWGLNQKFEVRCPHSHPLFDATCYYISPAWTYFGRISEGWFPRIGVSAKLSLYAGSSEICGSSATWEAEYEVMNPRPLWVVA